MVTESAYEVLDGSSSLIFPRLLWIESLCINQHDDIERAEQVQLMGTIYGMCRSRLRLAGLVCRDQELQTSLVGTKQICYPEQGSSRQVILRRNSFSLQPAQGA
jgi:hypothetical protein